MPLILSDMDIEAMETINYTIDQIMALDDADYLEASEKVLTIVRRYLDGLLLSANPLNGCVYDPQGGRG